MTEEKKDLPVFDYNKETDIQKKPEKVRKEPDIAKDDLKNKVAKISVSFDPSKISDLKYIFDIFSPQYDKFKSLEYIEKTHKELLAEGYPQTPALNEYLFWTAISRRMQIIYQEYHKEQMSNFGDLKDMLHIEDTDFLESLRDIAAHITVLQKAIDSSLLSTSQVKDVVDLHKDTCEKAVKFLQSHFGEYVKQDSASGKITDITDKAYWAFVQDLVVKDTGQEVIDYVWSEELKFLVDKKLISVECMAFILRTSIQALQHIAHIRKDVLEVIDLDLAEKNLKALMLEFEPIRDSKDREIIEK